MIKARFIQGIYRKKYVKEVIILNKKSFTENKVHLGYFILAFVLFFMISYCVILFIETEISKVQLDELKSNENRVINLEVDGLSSELDNIYSDIHYLHEAFEYDDLKGDPNTIRNWTIFSNNRKIYDQIRFIDEEGNEVIRINYSVSGADSVEAWELQNKNDRYYFKNSLGLQNGQVYISPLDLNIETGKVELPYKPMIRIGTPVFDQYGEKKGVVILNYLAKDLLSHFREIGENSRGETVLLNSDGYWLSSDNPENEWNFMFEDNLGDTFASKYPEVWDMIISDSGQILNDQGLFSYKKMNVIDLFNNGEGYSDINLTEENWYIVSIVEKSDSNRILFASGMEFLLSVYIKNRLFFRLITFFSFLVAVMVYVIRKTYSKVKYFSEFDSLTNVYNRRAGLAKINEKIVNQNRRSFKMSLCFVDINGLKVVNDSLGHKYGDELIVNSVNVILSAIRECDFVLRMGGDEFLIAFDGIDKNEAEMVWQRILEEYENINDEETYPYLISISHGMVEIDNLNSNIDLKLKEADEKMYTEKKNIKRNLNVLRKKPEEY